MSRLVRDYFLSRLGLQPMTLLPIVSRIRYQIAISDAISLESLRLYGGIE
jgi:hypothetical protein